MRSDVPGQPTSGIMCGGKKGLKICDIGDRVDQEVRGCIGIVPPELGLIGVKTGHDRLRKVIMHIGSVVSSRVVVGIHRIGIDRIDKLAGSKERNQQQ
ncbi:MAG: hypothetical protein F6K11_10645 [Leptolyngbya sp. SIO3F4]|nr:hypothetical protein [Leptolyngbya sp. SIO3F4]